MLEISRLHGDKCGCTENRTALSTNDLETASEVFIMKAHSFLRTSFVTFDRNSIVIVKQRAGAN
jgi:hypothetical protein